MDFMNVSFIVASNEREVLKNTLLASPDLHKETEILVQIGKRSAAEAYNEGILKSNGDTIIFVHQDVYLPKGWLHAFKSNLIKLELIDSKWGVLGLFGMTRKGEGKGYLYSTGLKRFVGSPLMTPERVRTLDEILLAIRRNSGLFFDEKLPGFHLYGTDLCLEAEKKGMSNYVLPGFAIHNSNGIESLPLDFWKAYFYLRHKWWNYLPIRTSCTVLKRLPFFACKQILKGQLERMLKSNPKGRRVRDPQKLYHNLLLAGLSSHLQPR